MLLMPGVMQATYTYSIPKFATQKIHVFALKPPHPL